jgi:putative FmdB family regulatory protein
MPVYEYICKACDHEFEREQRISDNPLKKCPSCGAMKVKRLISRTSFVLKGGGWYSDLYSSTRDDSRKSESSPETNSKSDSSSKSDTASPSKPPSDKKKDSPKGSRAAA